MALSTSDLIAYYQSASGEWQGGMHVVEAVQLLSKSHDFEEGVLIIPEAYNLDRAFLFDSVRHIGASLLQFLAHSYLDQGGYLTWANVTRYYSRYFSAVAFTRLLGYGTLSGE